MVIFGDDAIFIAVLSFPLAGKKFEFLGFFSSSFSVPFPPLALDCAVFYHLILIGLWGVFAGKKLVQ